MSAFSAVRRSRCVGRPTPGRPLLPFRITLQFADSFGTRRRARGPCFPEEQTYGDVVLVAPEGREQPLSRSWPLQGAGALAAGELSDQTTPRRRDQLARGFATPRDLTGRTALDVLFDAALPLLLSSITLTPWLRPIARACRSASSRDSTTTAGRRSPSRITRQASSLCITKTLRSGFAILLLLGRVLPDLLYDAGRIRWSDVM
jgi:hypothetical protein